MEPFFSGSIIGRTNGSLTWKISSRHRKADFRPPSGLLIALRPDDSLILVVAMRRLNSLRLLYKRKPSPEVNILTCSSPYDTVVDGAAPASATDEEQPRPQGVSSRG